ncbi:5-oxoprolinase, partial [Candidatus Poribacteria bacterium]|nr:5-oxoprolinase [Candidatus Poribacteria bacterium]
MPQRNSGSLAWDIWIDTGGTFTDCVAVDPAGAVHRAKVLSNSSLRGRIKGIESSRAVRIEEHWNAPAEFPVGFRFRVLGSSAACGTVVSYDAGSGRLELDADLPGLAGCEAFELLSPEEAPVLAARLVTRTPAGKPLPAIRLRLATTKGTNALLEEKGEPPTLFITRGFADLLEIGTQQRPDLFALDIRKPRPLYREVVEARERLDAEGSVLEPLDEAALFRDAERAVALGAQSAAVAFMHSYRSPMHEVRAGEILRAAGFMHVSLSSELAPFIRILPRAQTTVVNAYLAPLIETHVGSIASQVGDGALRSFHVMTSAAGLVRASSFRPKDCLLSGPAGGVAGAAAAGRAAGFERLI